jgi:hypothetical protein
MSVHRGWSQPVDATLYLKEKRWSVPAEPRRRSERRRAVLNQISWLALIAKNHGSHFFNDAESFEGVFRRSSFAEPNGDTVGYVRRLTGPAVTKIWR